MPDLTHFDEHGASRMVDVSRKEVTLRVAKASGLVRMLPATLALIRDRGHAKGDVLEVARLAGIMAAKRTDALIPLCHSLPLDGVSLAFDFSSDTTVAIRPGCVAMLHHHRLRQCRGDVRYRLDQPMKRLARIADRDEGRHSNGPPYIAFGKNSRCDSH